MKRVLITGATSGIGEQLVRDYVRTGWTVIACGRHAGRLQALADSLPGLQTLAFDITDLAQTRERLNGVTADLVILCAGTCEYLDHGVVEAEKVERVLRTNFLGPVNCLDVLLPQLSAGSRVALVGSTAGLVPLPRAEAYGASKAALAYFTRSLAQDLQRRQIALSLILPGFVDTPLTQRNDFPMPMIITAEQASRTIMRGLDKGRAEIAFPWFFALIMRLTALLPAALQRRLTQRIAR
ncbi:SDR family NAD(P)-dependent oxidoreductase [Pantoea sp. 1.19]|uniref:SDR family NAD(P)-dependent oxidoreductase n=1 Tax=Pantoea sp. 1.19 TaxID=1925589 RepID=UPI000948C255|nr:SDR family NAD(P)-dependent oxidoreductase [Pantoea sp. 1.19]